MSKPQTVTVECGGIPFTFRRADWRRFTAQRIPPGKPARPERGRFWRLAEILPNAPGKPSCWTCARAARDGIA